MTNQEAIEHIKTIKIYSYQDGYTDEAREALDMAISALQAQDLQLTCNQLATDCVSRQAAIDSVCKYCEYYYNESVIQDIKDLPPAQQDYDKIIAEIKQCISETREHGKHHAKFVQDNGELYISGLKMALSIIEENR